MRYARYLRYKCYLSTSAFNPSYNITIAMVSNSQYFNNPETILVRYFYSIISYCNLAYVVKAPSSLFLSIFSESSTSPMYLNDNRPIMLFCVAFEFSDFRFLVNHTYY